MNPDKSISMSNRRSFIKKIGVAGAAGFLTPGVLSSRCLGPQVRGEKQKKLGVALVGLGNYSTGQLAPALQETGFCRLTGIVTGTPRKEGEWMKKYNIPEKNVYNYDNFDAIVDNDDIDVIYVVLPNGMHAEYTIRAARAGKHVICEKPMAISVSEAESMIEACKENNVKLSLGYRLHFEPHHLRMMELGQEEEFGPLQSMNSGFSFALDSWQWRLDKEMAGGGPLMDVGIYTVQAACYNKGQWPVEVSKATYGEVTKPDLFRSVEQSITFTLKFPDGTYSNHSTSYADYTNFFESRAQEGWWKLNPAYNYGGIEGETHIGPMNFPNVNQQARQMDAFALHIQKDLPLLATGDMGLRDMKILMAVYNSADSGQPVKLDLEGLNIPKYEFHREVNEALDAAR